MDQKLLDFMRAFSSWIDQQEHAPECGFGTVVQSGPMEGNKIPCSCELLDLQKATNRAIS